LQEKQEIPLPASTQWGIMKETAERLEPALEELIRQAAQGEVVYNDDTGMKVLALPAPDRPERTGVFTSGIISTREGQRMALFFTGRRHAGENLSAVLTRWAADLAPPVQMCDALSRNLPKTLEVILGNCLALVDAGSLRYVEVVQLDVQRQFQRARQNTASLYSIPQLPLPSTSAPDRVDLTTMRQAITAAHHLFQLFQPQLETRVRLKLRRLMQRLLNIGHELDHLTSQ